MMETQSPEDIKPLECRQQPPTSKLAVMEGWELSSAHCYLAFRLVTANCKLKRCTLCLLEKEEKTNNTITFSFIIIKLLKCIGA